MVGNTYNFLKGRANSQFQLTMDELRAHLDAVEQTFGIDIDLAQLVKKYKSDESRACQASRGCYALLRREPLGCGDDTNSVS
jgi:hypothetical protein